MPIIIIFYEFRLSRSVSAALNRAAVERFGGIRRLVSLTNRAHLFRRRSQWEAVLLISLGQTLACVKCLQNQHWRRPRALVNICVCSCVSVCVCMCICTHKTYSVLGYKCVSVFACALKKIYLSVYLITFHFYFFSWQSCEHRASLHKGKAGRGVCIYLTDAYPDPQRRGHKHSHPGSFAGSHGSRAVRQQSAGVIVWKVSGHALWRSAARTHVFFNKTFNLKPLFLLDHGILIKYAINLESPL